MNAMPALTGWSWVKRGFAYFKQQPAEMLSLFFAYMFCLLLAGIIPLLGAVLPFLLMPVFSMGFMQACQDIDLKKKVTLPVLFSGFRAKRWPALINLGVLFLLAMTVAVAASKLVGNAELFTVLTSTEPPDPKTVDAGNLMQGMLVMGLVFMPALMAFWYAGPLIFWQKMSVAKALFFSFLSVKRAWRVFLVYCLCWMLLAGLLPALILEVLVAIAGQEAMLLLFMLPVLSVLTTIRYCSFYPSYTDVFGVPDVETQA